MKIEIDLNDILGDEYGSSETLAESVRRQVIDNLTKTVRDGIGKQIQIETARVLNEELSKAVAAQMPALLDDLMNTTYRPCDQWGSRSEPTTFRAQLVKTINEQMVYKKANYDSEKNAFTKAVDSLVSTKMGEFKALFVKEVDQHMLADTVKYAAERLTERLQIKIGKA